MLSRILVGDDLAREDQNAPSAALLLAGAFAKAFKSEIRLVHTYRIPEITIPTESMALIENPYVDEMERALEAGAKSLRSGQPDLKISTLVEKGDTVELLLDEIRRNRCDLVLLGTHGRKGVRRAILGSVAEEVVRRSPVPVVTINPHAEIKPDFRPARIVVPMDFSEPAQAALALAAPVAKAFGSPVTLVHVVEEWAYPVIQSASLLAGGFVMPLEKDLKELANARLTQLEELAQGLRKQGIEAQTSLIERAESAGEGVVSVARQTHPSLIIMGHRNASRIEYAVLGSTSRFVVREAHCPVLTISPPTAG